MICKEGWHRRFPKKPCNACPTEQTANIAISITVFIGAGIFLWIFLWFSRKQQGGKFTTIPGQLLGYPSVNVGGQQTCYAFNIEGCINGTERNGAIVPGDCCPQGWHRCANCGGAHKVADCRQ